MDTQGELVFYPTSTAAAVVRGALPTARRAAVVPIPVRNSGVPTGPIAAYEARVPRVDARHLDAAANLASAPETRSLSYLLPTTRRRNKQRQISNTSNALLQQGNSAVHVSSEVIGQQVGT